MAIFTDVELVSVLEGEPPEAYTVAFDVIYSGETWCRSIVGVETAAAVRLDHEENAVVRAARDALLEVLAVELEPVSFQLRLTIEGTTVLARAVPAG